MIFALSVILVVQSSPQVRLASCAWIRAENDSAGTAFVVDAEKRQLITCRHLVGEHTKVDVIFPWVRDGVLITDRRLYLAERARLRELGLLVTGTVVRKSDELDLALIEADSLPSGVRSVKLAVDVPLIGEFLQAVGNRLDLDTVWNLSSGPARAIGRLADGYYWRGNKLAANAPVLIAQLPTEEGDSGGPVFDARGHVVGMIAALRRQTPLAAVAIPAREIHRFAGLPESPDRNERVRSTPAEALHAATVWVRPTATDAQTAGVLIEKDLVLTIGRGFRAGDRVGIALPIRRENRWLTERAEYRDALGLALAGCWRGGTIIAHDADCDLALIRLDSPVADLAPLRIADRAPAPGDAVHTMNHPGSLEFMWVYAAGTVRQRGRVALAAGEQAKRVEVLLCQLPVQAGSPGGAVVDDLGGLVGIVAAKESVQMVGYAVAAEQIGAFLDGALLNRPARTPEGARARIEAIAGHFIAGVSRGLATRADEHYRAGQLADADRVANAALALDPGCGTARIRRAQLLLARHLTGDAMAELDLAIEKGPFNRDVLLRRAELAAKTGDWRKARGDLERILDVNPADAEARQWLANVHLELGDDAKAAAAIADTLRADPRRLGDVANHLLGQADRLEKKYPDAPSIPAGWLMKALTESKRDEFAETLRKAGKAKTDQERLAIVRAGVKKIAGR